MISTGLRDIRVKSGQHADIRRFFDNSASGTHYQQKYKLATHMTLEIKKKGFLLTAPDQHGNHSRTSENKGL